VARALPRRIRGQNFGSVAGDEDRFDTWCQRRLDAVELDYLFLDGSHFKYHANASAEPVLAAWSIDTNGKPVFVGLEATSSESGDAWEGFLTRLGERGLRTPLPSSPTRTHPGPADSRK
jgi:transposase-like protein